MAQIKYFRKSFTLCGGVRTDHRIEETHSWPMAVCMSFKASFPDQVISIDTEDHDHDHKSYHRRSSEASAPRKSWSKKGSYSKAPDTEIPFTPFDISGAEAINSALRSL